MTTIDSIEIPAPTGTVEAIVGRPDAGEHPGVLFLMDAIGVRPQIEAMVARIASWGYVVMAPNLFHREGTIEEVRFDGDLSTPEGRAAFYASIGPRLASLTDEVVLADNAAYVAALRALDGVAPGPMGATGYCMGGRIAMRAASAHPEDVGAVGSFHGGNLATDAPESPHRFLGSARAEFVFGHADQDGSMPLEAIEVLEQALTEAGLEFTSAVYQGASHGYTMNDTASYNEAGAERHYTELRALFARRLGQ